MEPARITGIQVWNHHTLPDFAIDLQGHRHLVITGPNGSGKTTLITALAESLRKDLSRYIPSFPEFRTSDSLASMLRSGREGRFFVDATFDEATQALLSVPDAAEPLFCFLPVDRSRRMVKPEGPGKLALDVASSRAMPSEQMGSLFLQYLVNLHTSMHLFRADEPEEAARIEAELERLRDALRDLFVAPDLSFVFDKRTFDFAIRIDGREQPWEHLAAGHQAVLAIVADVYTRAHAVEGRDLEAGGVVLIDEPELHLHPEMQERVLPALTGLFPNLQFIVATHAPPVISSLSDAWVFDLRTLKGISSAELQGRPYGSLMRSHFQVPTDYDVASTREVERLVAEAEAATSEEDKRRIRDALSGLLSTEDDRVLEWWNRLTLELEPV